MIEHIWSVVCERTILDRDSNLISIINSLEELGIEGPLEKKRILRVPIEIVSFWVRSDIAVPVKGLARYRFVSPSGDNVKDQNIDLDLSDFERLRTRVQFLNLNFPEPGIYHFQVAYRKNKKSSWKTVASIPLKINVIEKTEEPKK